MLIGWRGIGDVIERPQWDRHVRLFLRQTGFTAISKEDDPPLPAATVILIISG